jgi:hypothetical protein
VSDLHVLFLKNRRSISSAGWLELVDRGVLRAAFSPVNGPWRLGVGTYAALSGTLPVGDPDDPPADTGDPVETVETAYRLVCPSDTQPPCDLVLLQVFRGVISMLQPRAFVAFAVLRLDRGLAGRWASAAAELPEMDGAEVAAALAHGTAGIDAVVEVVADDLTALQAQLRAFTELAGVAASQVLFASGDRTRGFGRGTATV